MTPTPDIMHERLQPDDAFVVVATDGLVSGRGGAGRGGAGRGRREGGEPDGCSGAPWLKGEL